MAVKIVQLLFLVSATTTTHTQKKSFFSFSIVCLFRFFYSVYLHTFCAFFCTALWALYLARDHAPYKNKFKKCSSLIIIITDFPSRERIDRTT